VLFDKEVLSNLMNLSIQSGKKISGGCMKTVYILGAGASKSYSGSKTGVNPPLASELFTVFNKLDISHDRHVRIGDIVTYVRDTRGVSEWEFMNWNENIEDFLTEIEDKLLSIYKQKNKGEDIFDSELIYLQKVYDRMIFLFSAILNEIQNGSLYDAYCKLISQCNYGDTFITFNWDTLLDRALYETGNWYLEDGYHIPFKAVFRDGWEFIDLQHYPKYKRSKYNLYKLHGSTNWLIPYYTFDHQKGTWAFVNPQAERIRRPIYVFHYATKKYKTYDNRSRTGYEPFSYFYYPPDLPIKVPVDLDLKKARLSIGLYPDVENYGQIRHVSKLMQTAMPFIIPPVRKKNYSFLGGVLEELWKKSKRAVFECDQLIIIGYSFPPTDKRAWELLGVLSKKKKEQPKIKIIDPFPENIVKRIKDTYPDLCNNLEVYKQTIKEYLT
jgi:hypothetical protein